VGALEEPVAQAGVQQQLQLLLHVIVQPGRLVIPGAVAVGALEEPVVQAGVQQQLQLMLHMIVQPGRPAKSVNIADNLFCTAIPLFFVNKKT
jgi:hypothetical protein